MSLKVLDNIAVTSEGDKLVIEQAYSWNGNNYDVVIAKEGSSLKEFANVNRISEVVTNILRSLPQGTEHPLKLKCDGQKSPSDDQVSKLMLTLFDLLSNKEGVVPALPLPSVSSPLSEAEHSARSQSNAFSVHKVEESDEKDDNPDLTDSPHERSGFHQNGASSSSVHQTGSPERSDSVRSVSPSVVSSFSHEADDHKSGPLVVESRPSHGGSRRAKLPNADRLPARGSSSSSHSIDPGAFQFNGEYYAKHWGSLVLKMEEMLDRRRETKEFPVVEDCTNGDLVGRPSKLTPTHRKRIQVALLEFAENRDSEADGYLEEAAQIIRTIRNNKAHRLTLLDYFLTSLIERQQQEEEANRIPWYAEVQMKIFNRLGLNN